MRVTATQLRQDLYRLIDQVIESGEPLEIERKGSRLRIVAAVPSSKLDRLVPRADFISGDAEDLAAIDWTDSDPERALQP